MELLIALVVGVALGAAGCAVVVLGRAEADRRRRQMAIDAELTAARTRAERSTSEAQALRARLSAVEVQAARADTLDAELAQVRGELASLRTAVDRAPRPVSAGTTTRPTPARAPSGPSVAHEAPGVLPAAAPVTGAAPATAPTRLAEKPVEAPASAGPTPRLEGTATSVTGVSAPAQAPDTQDSTPRRRRGGAAADVRGAAMPPADAGGPRPASEPATVAPADPEPTSRARSSATPAPPGPVQTASGPRPDPAEEVPDRGEVRESDEALEPGGWRPVRAGLSDPRRWLGTTAPNGATYREDDLERIHGVGPYLARRLRDAGIVTWRQVAEWDDDDMTLMSRLIGSFPDRIRREDWPASARTLHEEAYGEVLS